jgi:hypothetical protein
MLTAEPQRAKLRKEKLELMLENPKTDTSSPNRTKLRTDKVEPMDVKSNTLIELPRRA